MKVLRSSRYLQMVMLLYLMNHIEGSILLCQKASYLASSPKSEQQECCLGRDECLSLHQPDALQNSVCLNMLCFGVTEESNAT